MPARKRLTPEQIAKAVQLYDVHHVEPKAIAVRFQCSATLIRDVLRLRSTGGKRLVQVEKYD